jgi:hypothetical protein
MVQWPACALGWYKRPSEEGVDVPAVRLAMVVAVAMVAGTLIAPARTASAQQVPPPGTFTSVSAGVGHTCALRTDRTLACWGGDFYGQATPPTGTFTSVDAGYDNTCGVRTDGSLVCWGRSFGWTPPAGTFRSVDVGWLNACALRTDATLACSHDFGSPAGDFVAFDVDYLHGCGLRADSTIVCFGEDSDIVVPPAGSFSSIVAGGFGYVCGIRADAALVCKDGQVWAQGVRSANVHFGRLCAIRTDRSLTCWGPRGSGYPYLDPPPGTFDSVSVGYHHDCAIRTSGTLVCWGAGYLPPPPPPPPPPPAPPASRPPPAAPPPAGPGPPAPAAITPARAFRLPSAKRCVSRRAFTIRIRRLPGVTWASARVRLDGKRVRTVRRRGRITARIDLRGRPRGRFTVRITATTTEGQRVSGQRRYRTCAGKRRSSGPDL